MTRKPVRDGAALYRALKEQEAMDDLEEIESMTEAELDAYITANGGDPKAIGESGKKLAEDLLARRLAWQGAMVERLESFRADAAQRRKAPILPRAELLARLEAARTSAQFGAPVAMLFQKKTAEASTDAELQALVDALDLLAKLEPA
jgi:hypothetical protein